VSKPTPVARPLCDRRWISRLAGRRAESAKVPENPARGPSTPGVADFDVSLRRGRVRRL